jgi:hypothetical protein
MDLLFHLFRRILPIGLIAGIGALLFANFDPVITDRVDAFGIDTGAGSGAAVDIGQSALAGIPDTPKLLVRVTLDWSQIETTQGEYNWSGSNGPDGQIAALASSNRRIIGVLNGGPSYLVSNIEAPIDQTQLLLRWAAFVQTAIDRYDSQIQDWEIGSQINTYSGLSPFLYPQNKLAAVKPDPVLYSKLVKTASAVIKGKDPNTQVWTGTLVSATAAQCAMNPATFLLELNASRAWSTLDGVDFSPERGAGAPEAQAAVTPECASGMGSADSSLTGETRAVQDIVRQLGGKQLRVSLPGLTTDELSALSSSRNLSKDQLAADYFTRASMPLLALNGVPSVLWSFDPAAQPASTAALVNLEKLLVGAKPLGQVQGEDGSIFEYRFQKGDQGIVIVWRSIEGDTAAPVALSNLETGSLKAFPVDAASFDLSGGTEIPVDENKNALLLVNERPVVLIGTTADLSVGIQQQVQNLLDTGQIEIKQSLVRVANQQKAAVKQWFASLFTSAKDQAVNWGEEQLNQLLN